MPLYHNEAALSPVGLRYMPRLEVKIASNGALLAASEARYDTLQEYVAMCGRERYVGTSEEI
jgi:hypothetical protein